MHSLRKFSLGVFITAGLLGSSFFVSAEAQWWKSASIYQVYPRSFKDSNGDGVGDIPGVISKLDYLKDLGVEAIWVSPFFKSPQKDFGYDISNYRAVDPTMGQEGDAERLIQETHKRGMKIIFDMVMNHTSDQHPWFEESRSSRDNPKADWYIWRDQPNNWVSALGKPGWKYEPRRNQWYFASFLPFQPDLNYRNPEVKKAMLNHVRYWLEKGVDGFRLDIFNVIYKDAQFRNNPKTLKFLPNDEYVGFQYRKYTQNLPENHEFAKELRAVIEEYGSKYGSSERMLVGEVMGEHHRIKPFLGKNHDGLNLIFLFDILKFDFKADFFREKLALYEREYPAPYVPTYVFSNHDQMRSLSRLGGDLQDAKLLALLQLTARGVPVIYQGEEIGMENGYIQRWQALDPVAKIFARIPDFLVKMFKITINRDVVRTPFQWRNSGTAGFCEEDCRPWLPVFSNRKPASLENQLSRPNSLYFQFKTLLEARKSIPALREGSLELLPKSFTGPKALGFDRVLGNEKIRVLINFSNKSVKIPLEGGFVLVHELNEKWAIKNNHIVLGPKNGLVIRK